MLHPVRLRIVQALATRESVNATELCELINDVPRTTLYRHINILLNSAILSVVAETKLRGSLERTLALNKGELSKRNTRENVPENALRFLMDRYAKFHRYFSRERPNAGRELYFFNTTILMMDDAEFDRFLSELRELLLKYSFETAKGRKPRDISIISSPVEED